MCAANFVRSPSLRPSCSPSPAQSPVSRRPRPAPVRGTSPAHHHRHHTKARTLPGGYKHLVVIYEENHSFDNLYGAWGDVNGQHVDGSPTPRRQDDAGRPGRYAVRLPAAERRQPDVAAPADDLPGRLAHGITASHFTNEPFAIDDFITPTDTTCPRRARRLRGERRAQGPPGRSGWLHRGPRAPLLPGAVPDRRRQAGPLHHRVRRGRPDPGLLRHHAAADLPATCTARAHRSTSSPTTSSRRPSAARSSTTSG